MAFAESKAQYFYALITPPLVSISPQQSLRHHKRSSLCSSLLTFIFFFKHHISFKCLSFVNYSMILGPLMKLPCVVGIEESEFGASHGQPIKTILCGRPTCFTLTSYITGWQVLHRSRFFHIGLVLCLTIFVTFSSRCTCF